MNLSLIITFVVTLAALFILYRLVAGYRAASGSTFERLVAAAKGSATILWQYAVIVGGAFYSSLGSLTEFANMPELKQVLQDHLSPQSMAVAMLVIAAVSIAARLRTL